MGRIVGIDLGTTNSLVAYVDAQTGQPKCIPGPYGSTLCPSVVSLDADGSVIVGEAARRRLLDATRAHDLFGEAADGAWARRCTGRTEAVSFSHRCFKQKCHSRQARG